MHCGICDHYSVQSRTQVKSRALLGFCGMVLKTCEYDASPVFQRLLDSYRAEFEADPALFGVSKTRFDALIFEGTKVWSTS